MDSEFSLLKHLNVKIDQDAERPRDDWRPARGGTTDHLSQPRPHSARYAEPTGEVIRAREKGEAVEYDVYDSKIPSIYGINKQMAERKRHEVEERAARERADAQSQQFFRHDEDAAREATRRRVLDELRRCNEEQADRRREEGARSERYRMQRDADALRAAGAAEADRLADERQRKLASQAAVCESAERAIADRHRRDAEQRATDLSAEGRDYMSFLPGGRHGEEPAPERLLRQQQLAADNLRMADESLRRRRAEQAQDRLDAQQASEQALRSMQEENERRLRDRAQTRRSLERHAGAVADRRQRDEEDERRRFYGNAPPPFATHDDEAIAARRAAQFRADQEINLRLAEERRARDRAEAEHDALMERERVSAVQGELALERERERERRLGRQLGHREEAERWTVQRVPRVPRVPRRADPAADAMVPVYLQGGEEGAARRREEARRRLCADLERQIEEKRRRKEEDDLREGQWEREAAQYNRSQVDEEERQRRAKHQQQQAELQRVLEMQIAQKQRRDKTAGAADYAAPAPERRILYRCPVTHRLLPASAFDFRSAH